MSEERTRLSAEESNGLGELTFLHPPGTFALTPASVTALHAIAQNQNLLSGSGLDWGTGVGCLAIAACRIPSVTCVTGLEISAANCGDRTGECAAEWCSRESRIRGS